MKISTNNANAPANPTVIKWFSAITLATISLPVWINEIPIDVDQFTKDMIEWCFKGVNVVLSILAVFTRIDPQTLHLYYNRQEIEAAARAGKESDQAHVEQIQD